MTLTDRFGRRLGARERRRLRLRAGRTRRLVVVVVGSVAAGVAAVLFAKLADLAQDQHAHLVTLYKGWAAVLLPLGLPLAVWLTRRFAPEAAGSGIPQIIAAAESQTVARPGRDPRLTIRTALWKIAVCALLLLCGASIGREGPTVQVCAAIVYFIRRAHPCGRSGRRALLDGGGGCRRGGGVQCTDRRAWCSQVEELSKVLRQAAPTPIVIMVVVGRGRRRICAGRQLLLLQPAEGNETALGSAWYSAPVVGVVVRA